MKLSKKQSRETKAVSLSPEHISHADARAQAAGITFSRYIQALINYDLERDILRAALTVGLREGK